MTQTKRYITESTKPNGEIVREERIVYVSKSGMEFSTAEAAYRDDIERQFHDILGTAVEPVAPGYGGRFSWATLPVILAGWRVSKRP
jgi:hypothetical protein